MSSVSMVFTSSSNNVTNNYGSIVNKSDNDNDDDDEYTINIIDNSIIFDNDKSADISHQKLSQNVNRSISVIANTTNALLGVSIFAMPWGFQQSGILGGSLITIFIAYIAYETVKILLLAQKLLFYKYKDVKSYPEITASTLGGGYITGSWYWATLVQSATVISCLGGCVGYLIFLGEITSQLFSINLKYAVIAASFPLTLLSWIRSFRDMTIFTIIGVIAIVLSVGAILYDGYNKPSIGEYAPLIVPKTSFNFLGPATFLFTIHYCVLSMGAENMNNDKNGNI